MGKIKGFLFAVRHREILMTDLGLMPPKAYNNPQKLLTPINATKPLKISGFVNVCYKFILVCLY